MKKKYLLIFFACFIFGGCKKSGSELDPDDTRKVENLDEKESDDVASEYDIIDGVKYDNQRVSVHDGEEITFVTNVFETLVDTIYRTQAGYIEWSILVPENDSISAEWKVESGIELRLSQKKKWIFSEQMWAQTFTAVINKVSKSGSADLGIKLTNHTTKKEIFRSIKVRVQIEVTESELNGAFFGNGKQETIGKVQAYFQNKDGFKPEWDELEPNVGYLPLSKFGGIGTTYEFESGKLKKITEIGSWTSSPDTLLWVNRFMYKINGITPNNVIIQYVDHGYGRYTLAGPVKWRFNGLLIGLEERRYVIDGVEGRGVALVFEKD